MTKILRTRGGNSPRTPQLPKAPSKFSEAARRIVTAPTSVKRLMVRAPNNAVEMNDKIAAGLTNNPNPKYHPRGVGAQTVQHKQVPRHGAVGKNKGHMKSVVNKSKPKVDKKRRLF